MSSLIKPDENSFEKWLKYHFVEKKFITSFRFLLMIVWGVAIAYVTSEINYPLLAVLLLMVIGIFILIICLRHPLFGLYITLLFSSLFALPGRLFDVQSPVGILVEVFTYVLWIAVLGNATLMREDTAAFRRNPITVVFIIIMIYYILEIANPAMSSKVGWLFFLRKQISYLLIYFITFMVLNSYDKIKFFLKFWALLAMAIAFYGIKQQWFGLADFEKIWLQSNPLIMKLYLQGGFLRKFSILTDPAAFGVLSAGFGMFTLVLGLRTSKIKIKYLLYFAAAIFFVASSYSGTRTCNLMIIAGLVAYSIFTFNEKKTHLLIITSFFIAIFLLFGPLQDNPVVSRVRSTFRGSNDASAFLRDMNRQSIQPYIRSHPMGGGLNTSSIEGQLYNPGHTLAGFPPDSGYMKILLEQGWIGLALHLVFYFVILKHGIYCFNVATDQSIKAKYIALTVCLFSLIVGQYSQISISQYPLILFYYSALAVLVKLIDYDKKKPCQTDITTLEA